jgi:hypothetical protein
MWLVTSTYFCIVPLRRCLLMGNVIRTHALWCLSMNGLQVKWLPCRTATPQLVPRAEPTRPGVLLSEGRTSKPPENTGIATPAQSVVVDARVSEPPHPDRFSISAAPVTTATTAAADDRSRPVSAAASSHALSVGREEPRLQPPPPPRASSPSVYRLRIPRSHSVLVSPRVKVNPLLPSARTSALSSAALRRTTAAWTCTRLPPPPPPSGTASGAMTNEVVGPRRPMQRDAAGTATTMTVTAIAIVTVKGPIGTTATATTRDTAHHLHLHATVTARRRVNLRRLRRTGTAGAPRDTPKPRMHPRDASATTVIAAIARGPGGTPMPRRHMRPCPRRTASIDVRRTPRTVRQHVHSSFVQRGGPPGPRARSPSSPPPLKRARGEDGYAIPGGGPVPLPVRCCCGCGDNSCGH